MGRETTKRRVLWVSVYLRQRKFPEDLSVYGNRKWEQLLHQRWSMMLIWCWKRWKWSFCKNGAMVEGIDDIDWNIWKELVEGKRVSWGGARIKGEGCEWKITKNMLLHSDLLKFCLNKKHNINEFLPDTTVSRLENSRC